MEMSTVSQRVSSKYNEDVTGMKFIKDLKHFLKSIGTTEL